MNTPEKVEEVVKEFWNKFSMYDLGYGDEVEAWLRTTLTQYHQDLKRELLEEIDTEFDKWGATYQTRSNYQSIKKELLQALDKTPDTVEEEYTSHEAQTIIQSK